MLCAIWACLWSLLLKICFSLLLLAPSFPTTSNDFLCCHYNQNAPIIIISQRTKDNPVRIPGFTVVLIPCVDHELSLISITQCHASNNKQRTHQRSLDYLHFPCGKLRVFCLLLVLVSLFVLNSLVSNNI